MWRTQQKLAEATFFLEQLDEHYFADVEQLLAGEPVHHVFPFYLSAFLSAARSVTWVMRSEYGKCQGWEEWFTSQHPTEHERALLRMFNDLRIRSEKIEPIIPGRHLGVEGVSTSLSQRDPRLPRFRVTITATNGGSHEKPMIEGEVVEYFWTLNELDGQELVGVCRQYHERLARLVAECVSHFGRPQAGPDA